MAYSIAEQREREKSIEAGFFLARSLDFKTRKEIKNLLNNSIAEIKFGDNFDALVITLSHETEPDYDQKIVEKVEQAFAENLLMIKDAFPRGLTFMKLVPQLYAQNN